MYSFLSTMDITSSACNPRYVPRCQSVVVHHYSNTDPHICFFYDLLTLLFSRPALNHGPRNRRALLTTFDLGTIDFYDKLDLFNTLNTAVNSGNIRQYETSPVGFTFTPLEGKIIVCVVHTGASPARGEGVLNPISLGFERLTKLFFTGNDNGYMHSCLVRSSPPPTNIEKKEKVQNFYPSPPPPY